MRNTFEACSECHRKFKAKPACQMMALLSMTRVKQLLKAFEHVGADYVGAYLTKQGREKPRTKRYLCLFTCFAARAVDLEHAYGLDTDSFSNTFTHMEGYGDIFLCCV